MSTSGARAVVQLLLVFCYILIVALSLCCTANDTLTQSEQISVAQTLVSASQDFEMGFFSPGNSGRRYVGIRYKKVSVSAVVWVANRENPLLASDSAATLSIGGDGNLKILDGNKQVVWSTNISGRFSNSTFAALQDSGDLVLRDNISGLVLWESFRFPGDTLVPTMRVGVNMRTMEELSLSSWQAEDDPSPGRFSVKLSSGMPPQPFILEGSKPIWRGGPWDGSKFIGIEDSDEGYSNGMTVVSDIQEGSAYFFFNTYNKSFIKVMRLSPGGSLMITLWNDEAKNWITSWNEPTNPCGYYGTCGPFGVCNQIKSPICECLKGFVPKSSDEWDRGNWTSGCSRRSELSCGKNTSNGGTQEHRDDEFEKLGGIKLPDHFEYLFDIEDFSGCQQWCLKNCSCVAYAFVAHINCLVWVQELVDIHQFSDGGNDLLLRLAHSEFGNTNQRSKRLIVGLTTVSGILLLCVSAYGLYKWKSNQRGKRRKCLLNLVVARVTQSSADISRESESDNSSSDLPVIEFEKIVLATDGFSQTNKLGEGGFGSVFKGKLEDGQAIAVKRLSSHSGQGIEEFKNEIALISKLQHRNLVRLLGCCIQGDEKMVIYEYLANKSLDTFLFDPVKRKQLDWGKRFSILSGIARGLLYLHRDSCLRVIHRDLKPSNILLDDQMSPKISDFGLARTFRMTQELANTHRIVGTFGYMSPEYIIGGIFSERSDVFSFGVLLLEIVAGVRNTGLHHDDEYINLIGYAWKLWKEGRGLELLDQTLAQSNPCPSQVLRCIHVGLFCVQDHAADRPTMSDVVAMLNSETDVLPHPQQPKFTFQSLLNPAQRSNFCSVNEFSMSMTLGR